MAEKTLYGNCIEPDFPFHIVAKKIGWLSEELLSASRSECPDNFVSLLNTVLVWSRARTATWLGIEVYSGVNALVESLNAVLDQSGEDAAYHRLELVPRVGQLFITCRNSPRFDWNSRPTHLAIGRNLDFFAPGHIFAGPGPSGGRVGVHFFERCTGKPLTAETISFNTLRDDPASLERLKQFCNRKEAIFNDAMEQLGLVYRFKCQIRYPHHNQIIQNVMDCSTPPTLEWWEENFSALKIPDGVACLDWCGFETNFSEHWEMIRFVHAFLLKNFSVEIFYMFQRNAKQRWDKFDKKIEEVQIEIAQPLNPDKSESLFADLREEFSDFEVALDALRKTPNVIKTPTPNSQYRQLRRRVVLAIRWMQVSLYASWQNIHMHLFERWKLRRPLIWEGGMAVPREPLCEAHVWGYRGF